MTAITKRIAAAGASVAVALALGACAGGAGDTPGGLTTQRTTLGPVLADAKGMTLYTLKTDPDNRSECYGRCATAWPPLLAPSGASAEGPLTIVPRTDGTRQYAYRGRPLYLWVKDKQPGDVTGHNVGEVWFVAKP